MDGVPETIDGVETGNTVAPNRTTAPTVAAQQCGHTAPLMTPEHKALVAAERLRKNLADFDAEVAYELSTDGERADLWGEIDVNVEDLRAVLESIAQGEAGAAGYMTKDALQNFDANGTEIVDVMLYPKGTLRPENEIPLYTRPSPAPVPEAVEALRFYANPLNWTSGRWVRGGEEDDDADEPVANLICIDRQIEEGGFAIPFADCGDRARKALAALASNKPVGDGKPSGCAFNNDHLAWACERWQREVANRPLRNIHRRTLDDTWRQVIRRLGGDPATLLPMADHDTLVDMLAASGESSR